MSDLVERLRSTEYDDLDACKAADEIERLRAENVTLATEKKCLMASCLACGEQLHAIRESIKNHPDE